MWSKFFHTIRGNLWKIFIIFLCFCAFDYFLNFTLYNPQFITPIYSFFLQHHILGEDGPGYPSVSIKTLNAGWYPYPRATVTGTVEEVLHSGDGDWHINIQNQDRILVTEIIPEYPLPVPTVGDQVQIWGVTRFDLEHRWWELHPVIGWKKI